MQPVTPRRTLATGPGALLALGIVLLLASAVWFGWTARLVLRGETATGRVWHAARRTLWVEVDVGGGRGIDYIAVRRPFWPPLRPWRNRTVRIIYDPAAQIPGRFILRRGRVDAWTALWLLPTGLAAAGGTCCLLYLMSRSSRGRLRARLDVYAESPDNQNP